MQRDNRDRMETTQHRSLYNTSQVIPSSQFPFPFLLNVIRGQRRETEMYGMVGFRLGLKLGQYFRREMKGCHRKTFQAGKYGYGQRLRVSLQMTHCQKYAVISQPKSFRHEIKLLGRRKLPKQPPLYFMLKSKMIKPPHQNPALQAQPSSGISHRNWRDAGILIVPILLVWCILYVCPLLLPPLV